MSASEHSESAEATKHTAEAVAAEPVPAEETDTSSPAELQVAGSDSSEDKQPSMAEAEEAIGGEIVHYENSDSGDFTRPHPLECKWTMWYDVIQNSRVTQTKKWEQSLREIMSFSTVEDFWSLFNNLVAPGRLNNGCDYFLFKEGIRPMWEDEHNQHGGKWLLELSPRDGELVNNLWMETAMALVGEAFEDADEICGIRMSARKKCLRLALWTRNAANEEACIRIGDQWKTIMQLPDGALQYSSHSDDAAGPSFTV